MPNKDVADDNAQIVELEEQVKGLEKAAGVSLKILLENMQERVKQGESFFAQLKAKETKIVELQKELDDYKKTAIQDMENSLKKEADQENQLAEKQDETDALLKTTGKAHLVVSEESVGTLTGHLEQKKSELNALNEENKKLEVKLSRQQETSVIEKSELQSEVDELQAEKKQLTGQLAEQEKTSAAKSTELKSNIVLLQAENRRLVFENEGLERLKKEVFKQKMKLEKKLKNLQEAQEAQAPQEKAKVVLLHRAILEANSLFGKAISFHKEAKGHFFQGKRINKSANRSQRECAALYTDDFKSSLQNIRAYLDLTQEHGKHISAEYDYEHYLMLALNKILGLNCEAEILAHPNAKRTEFNNAFETWVNTELSEEYIEKCKKNEEIAKELDGVGGPGPRAAKDSFYAASPRQG